MTDTARCPKRTSTCPAPSYCQPACQFYPAKSEPPEEDGFITVHPKVNHRRTIDPC